MTENPAPTGDADGADAAWSARRLALLAITALALYLCWLVARPFVASLTWATALAVIAWPLHRRFARYLRRPWLAATLSCLVVFIAIGVPMTMLVPRIIAQATSAIDLIREWLASGDATRLLEQQAWLRPAYDWAQANIEAGALVQRAGDLLAGFGKAALASSLDGLLQMTLTIFLLFYFLRDRDAILGAIAGLAPLSRLEARTLLREIGDTLHATLVGKVLVSLLQGALGGVMFFALGVPAALFWSVVMAVLALVPVLGTPVIWVPAAAWLALEGSWVKAGIMVGWGTAVVGMADNLIYPMMVGNRVRLHTVPMLLSMIGGIFVFGMAGFFVGPVVLATTLALLRIWSARAGGGTVPPEAPRATGGDDAEPVAGRPDAAPARAMPEGAAPSPAASAAATAAAATVAAADTALGSAAGEGPDSSAASPTDAPADVPVGRTPSVPMPSPWSTSPLARRLRAAARDDGAPPASPAPARAQSPAARVAAPVASPGPRDGTAGRHAPRRARGADRGGPSGG